MSNGPDRKDALAGALRNAAARFARCTGTGGTLLFAALPGDARPDAARVLRAAAGFAEPARARAAAREACALLSGSPKDWGPEQAAPLTALAKQGDAGTLLLPLRWQGRTHGAVVVGMAAPLSAPSRSALEELAERTALELDHAHLEHHIAEASPPRPGQDDELFELSEALFAQDIELRRNHEHVRRIEALKDDFIEKMSRELRTPLNSIIEAIIGVLAGEHETISDTARTRLRSALDAGTAFQRTLENILDLWRLRQQDMSVETQEVDVAGVVEEAIFSVQDALDGKPVTVEQKIDPALPRVRTDLAKLSQLFFLLLDNAVKFTPRGRVGIGARLVEDRLVCTVADTGIGVCADDLPSLFEDFYQVDAHTAAAYPGAGLGLAVVRELVALMNGTVELQSEAGKGTRVTFAVPVRPAPSATSGELS